MQHLAEFSMYEQPNDDTYGVGHRPESLVALDVVIVKPAFACLHENTHQKVSLLESNDWKHQ